MSTAVLSPLVLKSQRPSRVAGVLVGIAVIAAATALIYPHERASR